MTKREVALKGITPENLSRQVNGHTEHNPADAEHYANFGLHTAASPFVQQPGHQAACTLANESLFEISQKRHAVKFTATLNFTGIMLSFFQLMTNITADGHTGMAPSVSWIARPIDENRISRMQSADILGVSSAMVQAEHGSDVLCGNIFDRAIYTPSTTQSSAAGSTAAGLGYTGYHFYDAE